MTTHETTPAPKQEDFTFSALLKGREAEFPTLARAASETVPAHDVLIYWTVDRIEEDGLHAGVWCNYQQIFRWPYRASTPEGSSYRGGDDTQEEASHDFLHAVEQALIHGHPTRRRGNSSACATLGGYRHYLGRDLRNDDKVMLRPLREPFLWTHEWDYAANVPLDTPKYEWLAEVSLQVVPGAA